MKGETVQVLTPVETGKDAGNNPVISWKHFYVDDVLVAPKTFSDVVSGVRPAGTKTSWILHFPKSFTASLRGCRVVIRGRFVCAVEGDPQPLTLENTPTRWDRPVTAVEVEG